MQLVGGAAKAAVVVAVRPRVLAWVEAAAPARVMDSGWVAEDCPACMTTWASLIAGVLMPW